jgi:hypothetical protein
MKKLQILLIATLLAPVFAFSQNMQDVIYLKDGSIYKGVIIEEIPGKTYKIESSGGNIFAVQAEEVEKLTKEKHKESHPRYGFWGNNKWQRDTSVYEPKKSGYFFESQVLIENRQGGGRIVNGYRFNKYAQIGVGIGVDFLRSSPWNERINDLDNEALAGTYPSMFIYFQSEAPFGRRVRPYFALEAGYTMAVGEEFGSRPTDDFGNVISGGPMAGLGLGFKIRPRRKMPHFSVLFNINYKGLNYERQEEILDSAGIPSDRATFADMANIVIPGIRLGIGF